jgi:diguanylate cyclase (GGDEF)-like protein
VRDRRQGSHLAPVLVPGRFAVWWWVVVLVGGWLVVRAVLGITVADLAAVGTGFWLLLAFVVLAELRPVIASTSHDPDGVSLATAFVFAILLHWGVELATLTVVLAMVVGEVARRKRVYAAAFNIAQFAIAYGAAAVVLAAAGLSAAPRAPVSLHPLDLVAVSVGALTYHLANLTLVGTAIGLVERRPILSAVTEKFLYYTVTATAVLALAPLVVLTIATHWGFLPLLLVPLYTLWATARLSVDRERRALLDGLTGIANRAGLEAELVRRLTAYDDGAADGLPIIPFALVVIDLDRFKEVNDTLGHGTGDDLLRAVAGRLAAEVRAGDLAARFGGDEFALLVEVTDLDEARRLVDRIAEHLRRPFELGGVQLEVELSAGIAMVPAHGRTLDDLLRRADTAMYEAKAAGEVVVSFRPELDAHAPSRLQLLSDLRRGIARGEIEVHYQPQLGVVDGKLLGVEGLVRWRHPRRGLLTPAGFLRLAERTATMRELTSEVLAQALAQQAAWREVGVLLPVAVNVTLHDLADRGFVDRVVAGLAEHGLASQGLRLELTEQALIGDPARVLAALGRLADAGVELSLDDFGVGNASLTRLKRLPVHEVKIARPFVVDLQRGRPDDLAIVRSIVELAGALGLGSVAEGVETAEQLAALAALGCAGAQGRYLAPVMAPGDATAWLRARLSLPAEAAVVPSDGSVVAPPPSLAPDAG